MRVGIAADHGGYQLKEQMIRALRGAGHRVRDFGAYGLVHSDDYPDYVVPLARAVAGGEVERGIAVCASGIGASIAANKVPGVRAALIHEGYSAWQGVEDDDMNVICLGGNVVAFGAAWDLVQTFLRARFRGAERFRRRLAKISTVEQGGSTTMKENPLRKLASFGQSIWLDYIRRQMIASGKLEQLIDEDGLRGVTSNPSIFEKAIAESHDYDRAIRALAVQGKSAEEIYTTLAVEDVQRATDLFRPLYDESGGQHGFVSLEVSPHLAHDTRATIDEARRLWTSVDRPNVLIKVPGTREGLPAIRQLISEGINVNVTLLFGIPRYREVAEAYLAGLEDRLKANEPIDHVASVASFFLSRIDVLVDPMLEKRMNDGGERVDLARRLHGQVAIASAKSAYQNYRELFQGERFEKLAAAGARPQRVLWASTSTKNPDYSDVKYVEALIGPETVNTAPPETLDAYRDHGDPDERLEEGLKEAEEVFLYLPELGIDIDQVTQQLEDEGVEKFIQPFDKLIETLEKQRSAAAGEPVNRQTLSLGDYASPVENRVAHFQKERFAERLWQEDAGLWKVDEAGLTALRNGMGWLDSPARMLQRVDELEDFVREVKDAGLRRVVHLGMGGSSLAPIVFQRALSQHASGGLPLEVLDTTDPATLLEVEQRGPLEETLFIVASKSGTTAETRAFEKYFYDKLHERKGDLAGENFIAITDPGTPLAELGRELAYRRVFLNFSNIGGRYSALSYFGLVPAALMGLDVADLLTRALTIAHGCQADEPLAENPGITLGACLGELALHGHDKVTFLVPESISTLGMWLEQLLAESTGKRDTGLIPVAGEALGSPETYGQDRLFVAIGTESDPDQQIEDHVAALEGAGHPVVRIRMKDAFGLIQEFFRWEVATATAGAVLKINPFDQPNVQESKENTNRLLNQVRDGGKLPEDDPVLREGSLAVYAEQAAGSVADTLRDFLGQARPGDYVAWMAYFQEKPETHRALQDLRERVRDGLHLATTLGYGPRFLHSTGQLHKGGPNSGLYIQLTSDDADDPPIPGRPYGFATFKRAQALGDLESLRKHGRRVIRIHLGSDIPGSLAALAEAVESARTELHVTTG